MQYLQPEVPTTGAERLGKLDELRGLAVLGILVMNIQSFAMVMSAYINPTAAGGTDPLNMGVWAFGQVFADQKFMTLFSLLYGAGVFLFSSRIAARGNDPTGLFFRRSCWLLFFGLIHGYMLWYGDILFSYALAGFVAFLLRKQSPVALMVIGAIGILVPFVLFMGIGGLVSLAPPESMAKEMEKWQPTAAFLAEQKAIYGGTWLEQSPGRIKKTFEMQILGFPLFIFWRSCGLMLWGIALMKWDVLTGKRSRAFYKRMIAFGLPIGLAFGIVGLWVHVRFNFDLAMSKFIGRQFNYFGSLFLTAAYIAMVMLSRSNRFTQLLASAGRMAFTNYLGQTVICMMIFYGTGLGLFGELDRFQQFLIVIAICLFQLFSSDIWLKHFRFGPMEWLWRCLTYRKWQPLKHKT